MGPSVVERMQDPLWWRRYGTLCSIGDTGHSVAKGIWDPQSEGDIMDPL